MKKLLAVILAALIVLSMTAALAEDVVIKWGVHETDNMNADVWQAIIDAFEADNPGIKIEKMIDSGDDDTAFWAAQLSTGNFPDICNSGSLASIEGVYAELPEDVQELFDPALLVTYNGKCVTVPSSSTLRMQCYYNIAVFEELGLTEPETYEDFLNICETIKAAGKIPLICGGAGDIWAVGEPWWISVVNQSLCNAYPDFNVQLYNGEVKWNNEVAVAALTEWQKLIEAGYYYEGAMSLSYSQASAEFTNGTAVMMIDGNWEAAALDAAGNTDFGVFVMPNPDGSKSYCSMGTYWGVAETSEHKEEAFQFLKWFFSNEEVYSAFLKADGANSSTKTIVTYEQGPVMQKYIENLNDCTLTPEIWKVRGDYALPAGATSFFDKSLQNMFTGADIASELDTWDEEYEMLKEDMA